MLTSLLNLLSTAHLSKDGLVVPVAGLARVNRRNANRVFEHLVYEIEDRAKRRDGYEGRLEVPNRYILASWLLEDALDAVQPGCCFEDGVDVVIDRRSWQRNVLAFIETLRGTKSKRRFLSACASALRGEWAPTVRAIRDSFAADDGEQR